MDLPNKNSSYKDWVYFKNQQREMQGILDKIPKDNIINRSGFEGRIKELKLAFKGLEKPEKPKEKEENINWHYFHVETPKSDRKIVAVYGDGSGADIFKTGKDGAFSDIENLKFSPDEMQDNQFFMWCYLPDNFKVYGEEL